MQLGGVVDSRRIVVTLGTFTILDVFDRNNITWDPRLGRTDAERNCISNIRAEGLSYGQAATQLSFYLAEARRRQLTGVALKEEAKLFKEG